MTFHPPFLAQAGRNTRLCDILSIRTGTAAEPSLPPKLHDPRSSHARSNPRPEKGAGYFFLNDLDLMIFLEKRRTSDASNCNDERENLSVFRDLMAYFGYTNQLIFHEPV